MHSFTERPVRPVWRVRPVSRCGRRQATARENARNSPMSTSGVSRAAKWPPWSNSDQRTMFHAPIEAVAPRTSPGAGRLEAVDAGTCLFLAGSDSLDDLAVHVAAKGFDFEVLDPPEFMDQVRRLADRFGRATR